MPFATALKVVCKLMAMSLPDVQITDAKPCGLAMELPRDLTSVRYSRHTGAIRRFLQPQSLFCRNASGSMRCLRTQYTFALISFPCSRTVPLAYLHRLPANRIPSVHPSPLNDSTRGFHGTTCRKSWFAQLKELLFGRSAPPAASSPGNAASMASPVSNFHLAEQIFKMTGQSYSEALPVNPVFVCIDCEAFELEQNKVTEVGVAVLDTRLLREVEPGENGKNWIAKMTYAHFRPVEYAYNVNRRFVHGAEDQFAFGNTCVHSNPLHAIADLANVCS